MKILKNVKKARTVKDVPNGDLFEIGTEMYFKTNEREWSTTTEDIYVKCYSVRTGEAKAIREGRKAVIIKSITVEYEE